MTLSFRPARVEDLDELVAIHTSAFPDPRSYAARVHNFTANPLGTLDDLWLAEEAGVLLAHAFLFPLEAWFGGQRVRVGGIATVGVAPPARGRGVASRLLTHVHEVARARGDAATVLYPFRQAFYTRLDYAGASPYRRLRFRPQAIPGSVTLRLRAATGRDRRTMATCWNAAAAARTGELVRTDRAWDARLAHERRTWLVAEGDDGIEGYVAWTVTKPDPFVETLMVVDELATISDRAWQSLWAAVGAQGAQVATLQADVPEDDPIVHALTDAHPAASAQSQVEHPLGVLACGPMIRIADPITALAARGWGKSGTLVLQVGEARLELRSCEGRGTVRETQAEPDLRLNARTLAAIAFGGLRVASAQRLGWIATREARAVSVADEIFALPPYFSFDRF